MVSLHDFFAWAGVVVHKVQTDSYFTLNIILSQHHPTWHSGASRHPNHNNNYYYWDFRAGRRLSQFPPMSPMYSFKDICTIQPFLQTVTKAPVVGRVAWPGGHGNRNHNLQIAGWETRHPTHEGMKQGQTLPVTLFDHQFYVGHLLGILKTVGSPWQAGRLGRHIHSSSLVFFPFSCLFCIPFALPCFSCFVFCLFGLFSV